MNIGFKSSAAGRLRLLALVLFLLACLAALWNLGGPLITETDEGFAANRSASFFRHGTWLVSFDDIDSSAPQFHKPPLWYWIVAAFYKAGGISEWTFRLPTALATLALAALLFRMATPALGRMPALWGAAISFCVPFYLFHARHAFLDLPLTLCGMLCVYFLAFARPGVAAATLAGLAAGAAIMIKGMAGAACLLPALAAALINRSDRRQLSVHVMVMLACALLPLFIYIQALPDAYRQDFLFSLLIKETGARVAAQVSSRRWLDAAGELWICLGALAPLALAGLGVLIFRARTRATITWLALTLVAILTAVSIHAHEKTAFTRYLLPAIPFLALLAAYAAQALPRAFRPAGYLVLAAATLHTALAASPRQLINKGARFDNPGAARLAAHAKELTPPGDSILVHGRPKCHAILFYGQRPVENTDHWLKTNPPTGAVHYVISWRIHAPHLPNLRTEPVATDGAWSLDRITVVAPP